MVTVRPALEQDAMDLLELYWEQQTARLGLQELFESGIAGDLTG